ncbi:unnamed protein product [Peniophora sp. CBMAI 1063]|nr:unnamed protein product [Peniophora sp. CBMAI 1063]
MQAPTQAPGSAPVPTGREHQVPVTPGGPAQLYPTALPGAQINWQGGYPVDMSAVRHLVAGGRAGGPEAPRVSALGAGVAALHQVYSNQGLQPAGAGAAGYAPYHIPAPPLPGAMGPPPPVSTVMGLDVGVPPAYANPYANHAAAIRAQTDPFVPRTITEKASITYGYTAAHGLYDELSRLYFRQASATADAVTVKFKLFSYDANGKAKALGPAQTFSGVKVNIDSDSLKFVAWAGLRPLFIEKFFGADLRLNDILQLQFKSGAAIPSGTPQCIRSAFVHNRNAKREMRLTITSSSSVDVHVLVTRSHYQVAEAHMEMVIDWDVGADDEKLKAYGEQKWIERCQAQASAAEAVAAAAPTSNGVYVRNDVRTAPAPMAAPATPDTPAPSLHRTPDTAQQPSQPSSRSYSQDFGGNTSRSEQFLDGTVGSANAVPLWTTKEMLYQSLEKQGELDAVQTGTWCTLLSADLPSRARHSQIIKELSAADFKPQADVIVTAGSIHFDDKPRNADVMFGSFKIAQVAHIVEGTPFLPRPGRRSDQTAVCLKRVFTMGDNTRILLDAAGQVQKLDSEQNTLVWAVAAHNRSVQELTNLHKRGFKNIIGQYAAVRFVDAALARLATPLKAYTVFMVEEYISPPDQGHFRKYLDNRTGAISENLNARDRNMAKYLSCLQHVQYLGSDRTLFVADYQGGATLLTDPQIISDPDFREKHNICPFSDGNVPTLFQEFPTTHVCLRYCKHYKLEPLTAPSSARTESAPRSAGIGSTTTTSRDAIVGASASASRGSASRGGAGIGPTTEIDPQPAHHSQSTQPTSGKRLRSHSRASAVQSETRSRRRMGSQG